MTHMDEPTEIRSELLEASDNTKWIMLGVVALVFSLVMGIAGCTVFISYNNQQLCREAMQSGNTVAIMMNCKRVN